MTRPDEELMLAVKKGNQMAFTELVRRYQKPLINFFFKYVWDQMASEDYAQEVFLKVFVHAGTYEPKAKFKTFLYTVAHNLLIDKIRMQETTVKAVSLDSPVRADEDTVMSDMIAANCPAPPEVVCHKENSQNIRKALDQLPENIRTVVILSETQGMTYAEISEILNIPIGTVKSRLHYGIMKLKTVLLSVYKKQISQN